MVDMKFRKAIAKLYRAGAFAAEADRFKGVKSTHDCLAVFEVHGLVLGGAILPEALQDIFALCRTMRDRGWSLEPNLIGRATSLVGADCVSRGDLSLKFSNSDTDFVSLRSEAESRQSDRAFSDAEALFWRCLGLFPCHPAVLVQYAHCLKEQEKWYAALLSYIDARTFGAPTLDVQEHAIFVARSLGLQDQVTQLLSASGRTIPSNDVRQLHEALIGHGPEQSLLLSLVLTSRTVHECVAELVGLGDFARSNRLLLRLVAERSIGGRFG